MTHINNTHRRSVVTITNESPVGSFNIFISFLFNTAIIFTFKRFIRAFLL